MKNQVAWRLINLYYGIGPHTRVDKRVGGKLFMPRVAGRAIRGKS